ncbi:MAG: hypothetical protein ACKO97_14435, partial [Actinomycetota bacterium]
AGRDDTPVNQHVHEVGLHFVEQTLVVSDEHDAEMRARGAHLADALGDDSQRVDVEPRIGLIEDREVRAARPQLSIVLITHYQRLLDEVKPDFVHVLVDGRIVATGGMELAERLEKSGYDSFRSERV